MKTDFSFKGMMVPVFTPFIDDQKRSINIEVIDVYIQHLKSMGMHGVMINGMIGEGLVMTVDERIRMTEVWHEATRKHGMKMLVNIGGMDLPSIYRLAEHAEKLKVDAVMLMADLFYRPMVEEDLMLHMKDIMARMPTRPVIYYHIPKMTKIRLDMHRLVQLMDREVPMFAGIYWADDRIDQLVIIREKLPHMNYIVGSIASIVGQMAEGIEALSLPIMNIWPEIIRELYDLMLNRNLNEAVVIRNKLMKRIMELFHVDSDLHINMDVMVVLRLEMEKIHPTIKLGPMRRPHMTINRMLW